MSKEINNREYRQNIIRELLSELHAGKSVDAVKARFEEAFDGVSASEISAAEQALIANGMPVEEVQRLCDVHAAVFRDTLEAQAQETPEEMAQAPGHPIHTMKEENRALENLMDQELASALSAWEKDAGALPKLREAIEAMREFTVHYVRKEHLLFPYMEQHGITAPPKVMWGVDDEIRNLLKQAAELSQDASPNKAALKEKLDETVSKVKEMIFKEENIMFPMLLEALSPEEWKRIEAESGELGFFRIRTPPAWTPPVSEAGSGGKDLLSQTGSIVLPTGVFQIGELVRMLDTLPIDLTFVDQNDTVKYFSQGSERIFPRTKAVIGRNVKNCHPPASVHIVEGILADFKSGKKTHEDFWIPMGDKLIYIRYFAMRDESGEYLGTLEVTQNIKPIQELTGEKRLVEK